jgi:hypothetical protein
MKATCRLLFRRRRRRRRVKQKLDDISGDNADDAATAGNGRNEDDASHEIKNIG